MKLVSLNLEQCEIIRQWRNDCLETLRTSYPLTKEMQAEFYHNIVCNRNSPHRYWAILEDSAITGITTIEAQVSPKDCLIGMGGITNIQWENRIGEVSLIIDPALREKGYGEKAVDLLLDVAFNQMGLNCVKKECYTSNESGVFFWTKMTDKYNSNKMILRAHKFWQGKFWDSLYFDILKDEYERTKSSTTDSTLQSS